MWLTTLKILKGILKRPWIIAIIFMLIFMGYQWIQINNLKGDIVDLRSEIVNMESNFNTCKSNEKDLLDALDIQNGSIDSLNTTISSLQDQIRNEQKTSSKWEQMYKNRPVITEVEQIPVIEYVEKGVVVNEDTSKEYTKYFNTMFGN